ncbi:hypothetical protein CJU90_3915 [Yarrowia sp. C11]|nr:hypothetical protein CKK34_5527 [Yarrowia sp. E02]KAG5367614.1 hypothetical protein CJU90_3915 [Yarrowia sp. C11]
MSCLGTFIHQMNQLMSSHISTYELLFRLLDFMKQQDCNQRVLVVMVRFKQELDKLPTHTIPTFESSGGLSLRGQEDFSRRMNAILYKVAHTPEPESTLENSLIAIGLMYVELESHCAVTLGIIRDMAEIKFGYLNYSNYPKTVEKLMEEDGFWLEDGDVVSG